MLEDAEGRCTVGAKPVRNDCLIVASGASGQALYLKGALVACMWPHKVCSQSALLRHFDGHASQHLWLLPAKALPLIVEENSLKVSHLWRVLCAGAILCVLLHHDPYRPASAMQPPMPQLEVFIAAPETGTICSACSPRTRFPSCAPSSGHQVT